MEEKVDLNESVDEYFDVCGSSDKSNETDLSFI